MASTLDERETIEAVISTARKKKAFDEKVLDLRGLASFTEYFVILCGSTRRQVKAIAEAILEELKSLGTIPLHAEGMQDSEWVLIDCNAFVVHVFTPARREFYDLDRLWVDAEELVFEEDS